MLSGSGVYDAKVVKDRLYAGDGDVVEGENVDESGKGKGRGMNVLALESAILDGKVRLIDIPVKSTFADVGLVP